MRFFPRRHTPESVAAELIEGLENGTITLAPSPLDADDEIAEALKLAAEINSVIVRFVPEYSLPELPAAEELASVERNRPGAVREFLNKLMEVREVLEQLETLTLTEARESLKRLRAINKSIFWLRLTLWVGLPALAIGFVAGLAYLTAKPVPAVLGFLFGLATLAVHSFLLKRLKPRQRADYIRTKLIEAVDDLAAKPRSFAN